MPYKLIVVAFAVCAVCIPVFAQDPWNFTHRVELRADYRWSDEESHPTPFPPGEFLETPDPGHHVELNVFDVSMRASAKSMPMAEKFPGSGGITTVGMDSSRASAQEWSGPPPP